MNGYYQNVYPTPDNTIPPFNANQNSQTGVPLQMITTPQNNHAEYAENIFELNIGSPVTVYFSYPDSIAWRDKEFKGTIVDAGKDYLLLKTQDNKTVLLWLIYINYAIFDNNVIHNTNR